MQGKWYWQDTKYISEKFDTDILSIPRHTQTQVTELQVTEQQQQKKKKKKLYLERNITLDFQSILEQSLTLEVHETILATSWGNEKHNP